MKWICDLWLTFFFSESLWCAVSITLNVLISHLLAHQSWNLETVSVPLLNEHLERTTDSDVNIYKHMLPQSLCSLTDTLLFCIFSLSFKWSAHHILSKTTLTLTVWQCKIHMGCFTSLDSTSSHNYVWIVPDLLGTFGFYLISSLPSDFACHKLQVNLMNVCFCW